ncbi:MAG: AAA family ATPase [Gammaproteobacteria bacterium]|nr:AAA family ATPase [Gammaproteobacteria bacterium]MBU1724114.1 AAA family ATPase [Gammaproteobacteria bacterium]MBU2006810.1 AAA family ATPase [Gammaproteobacteria bacterium]
MRIDRLDLMAYGAFTGKTLDLSSGSAGLHLIYGDNEAGKSTSLRAIIAWLFGIPARTTDNYQHAHTQLRIGGKLRLADGRTLEFIRRKGTKSTLLASDGNDVLEDAVLLPFLPDGIDEALFGKLYGIDHERLEAGGKELLNQSGDLGQALFGAALGVASPRIILSELQTGAEALFKPRASTKPVNQAIANFKEAQKRAKELSLPVAEWNRLKTEHENTLAQIRRLEEDITAKSKEKSRLERLNRVKGALAERRAILSRMQELGDVLVLPEDFEEQRKTAASKLQTASELKEKAEARLAGLQEEARSLNIRHELLDKEAAILGLYKELGAVEKTIYDRPQQDGQRRLLRNEATDLLKAVRSDLGIDEADKLLRPLLKKKNWVADLARRHTLLAQRKETAGLNRKDAENEKNALEKQLAEQPRSTLDLVALKGAVITARKAGELEKRLSEARQRAAESKTASENEFQRLGRFSGSVETLLRIALPVPETLDDFETNWQEISDEIREHAREQQKLEAEKQQAGQDLTALLLMSDAPTLATLEASRANRDQLWQLLKHRYVGKGGAGDSGAGLDSALADADIPALYEQKVMDADHIADRLRLEADQVVKRTDLEIKLKTLDSRLSQWAETLAKANAVRQSQQQAWDDIWLPLGIKPGTPREMKQWVLRVEKLLSSIQSANILHGSAENLAHECETRKQAIAAQIVRFDPAFESQGMGLEAMLGLCEQRIGQEEEGINRQRQLNQALKDVEIRLGKALENIHTLESEQSTWVSEWEQAIDGLGLQPDAHPQYALETLEQLTAFFEKFDQSEEKRRRIYGIDKVQEDFNKKVLEFVDGIAFNRAGQDANVIAAQLHQELNKAREARARLEKISDAEKLEADAIREAEITLAAANGQLAALRLQADAGDDAALIKASEASRKKRELQQKQETLEQELTRNGDGLTIAELEQEANASDIDAIESGISKVAAELAELYQQRDALRDQRQTLQNGINTKNGSDSAASASEEAEQHLASMVAGVEQYLRLQIAALILGQRIEDYRKKHQTPVLLRAGALFSRLTLGAYAGLRDELGNDDKPILLGVRPNNAEVLVDRMSDGTRAQLYLSLRLATLEQHLRHGEPMPFVVDDILIGFDDKRTKVGLEVLAEVAASTQVLLFTHHRRVLDLANTLEAQAGIYTHELT